MIITIDKRGSINLPSSIRNELGLKSGDYLDLSVAEGGALVLRPVAIYPSIWLSEAGLAKLKEARESGIGEMPDWFAEEMKNARSDYEQEVSSRSRPVEIKKADRKKRR
ncbi:MAG: AbrB/MazE/SpoVT family DNA-binding domain-containing protein [Syntrophobacteraceae bacterium]|jgi:AbrB family looped-hinge helix DNA binding protein